MATKSPAWLSLAYKEMAANIAEIPGAGSNSRIEEYLKVAGLDATDETPWCAAFVSWCMAESGYELPKYPARARSWLNFGIELQRPRMGCIVVLRRGKNPAQGHVGFYVGCSAYRVIILAGNQSDCVCEQAFRVADVIGYRWIEE